MAAETLSFEWSPAKLLQSQDCAPDFALLILNQPLRHGANLRRLWRNASLRVAADGGANRLHELSSFQAKFSNLHAIVGDLDSLEQPVRDFYASQPQPAEVVHDADQNSTDFGKAIKWIRSSRPASISGSSDTLIETRGDSLLPDIVAMGGIGGRVDQGLSQLHHLYLFQADPDYASGRIFLLSGSSLTFLLKRGAHRIRVREDGETDVFGKHVGIIPLQEPSVITTRGLEWDVEAWETQMGGQLSTSNHVLAETRVIEVETSKDVLFTIALRQTEAEDDA